MSQSSSLEAIKKGKRLESLDVFRGATVAAMILVNNPGSWSHIYDPLEHASWHGWTPTDLIFPFFLFIVGVSIVFAFSKRIAKGADISDLRQKTLVRAAKIFGLGLFLAGFPFFTFSPEFGLSDSLVNIRIPGVLQRIAICYLIASLFYLYSTQKLQYGFMAGILLGYWAIMEWIPVPGHGAGMIDQPHTNLAAYIDQLVLGDHMWKENWDPEGILSTLPAIVTTMLGMVAGRIIITSRDEMHKVAQLLLLGSGLIIVGYVWDLAFPINKNIWTSSYTIFTAGQGMVALGMCYYIIDIRNSKSWITPFKAYGMNPLIVFFMSGILGRIVYLVKVNSGGEMISLKHFLYTNVFSAVASPINASLLYAITWILFWLAVVYWMYRKKIFIKV